MSAMHPPRRGGGMQVHAVPEGERAIDPNTGQRLPWGYEFADPERTSQRRVPEERGPFGRSTQRRTTGSRSRTTPGRAQERDKSENWKTIDDIFTRAKENKGTGRAVPAPDATQSQGSSVGVPTECILYGFPEVYEYSAIEFYERVSLGAIYEDYDRLPEHTRFDLTLSRAGASRKKIPSEALKKVNRYHGGEHWIKVTFDSAEAADRACYYSPHTLHGHIVYCEPYRGQGPARDETIPATAERLASVTASPSQGSSSTVQPNGQSPSTLSSATIPGSSHRQNAPLGSSSTSVQSPGGSSVVLVRRRELIRGASRINLLPAESALLPTTSRWQQTFGSWPILGLFFGAPSHDMIGNELPRKEDGSFDWDNATTYWKFWALLDYYLFFANFLGLKDVDKNE